MVTLYYCTFRDWLSSIHTVTQQQKIQTDYQAHIHQLKIQKNLDDCWVNVNNDSGPIKNLDLTFYDDTYKDYEERDEDDGYDMDEIRQNVYNGICHYVI